MKQINIQDETHGDLSLLSGIIGKSMTEIVENFISKGIGEQSQDIRRALEVARKARV